MNERNPDESTAPGSSEPTCDSPEESRRPGRHSLALGILKVSIVVAMLIFTFAAFTPERSRVFGLPLLGTVIFVTLACWPPYYQAFEAWMCLLVILAWGVFGAVRFVDDLPGMHPWDHGEFFRLYVGWALIAGIIAVTPYALLRLAVVRRDP